MKHLLLGSLAALVAGAITVLLYYYGAHDLQGLLAAWVGLPGLLVNGINSPVNFVLFTSINWIFYFLLFEGHRRRPRIAMAVLPSQLVSVLALYGFVHCEAV